MTYEALKRHISFWSVRIIFKHFGPKGFRKDMFSLLEKCVQSEEFYSKFKKVYEGTSAATAKYLMSGTNV